MELRGLYFGVPLAMALGIPFIPLRKPGKLPGPTFSEDFVKEYDKDTLTIQQGMLGKDDRVLIMDDLLATGGTAVAAINLVQRCEATVVEVCFVIELEALGGRKRRDENGHASIPYHSTLVY